MGTVHRCFLIWTLFSVLLLGWTQAENEQWVAPEIVGGLSEMLVEDGSNVNFTCRAAYPVTWCTEKNFASEHHQELYEEGQPKPYVAILTIDPVNYLHVGYYTCLYNTTTNRLKKTCDIKDPQISSIYLYVQDLSHLLVSEAYGFFFPLTVNEPFVIPCKPTFPDVEVSLEKIQTNEEYDPREGFKKYFTHEDTDICLAKYLNLTEQVDMIFQKCCHQELIRPVVDVLDAWQNNKLLDDGKEHYDVIQGASVNLTCTYDITDGTNTHKTLHWEKLGEISNDTGNHRIYRKSKTNEKIERVHMIVEADPDLDSGEYWCKAKSSQQESEPSFVVLNVIRNDSVNVILNISQPNITIDSASEITWEVLYQAYPKPKFRWYKEGKKEPLVDTGRHEGDMHYKLDEIQSEGAMHLIIDHPVYKDIGQYTLIAEVENKLSGKKSNASVQMAFTMPVKPQNIKLSFSDGKEMHKKGYPFKLTCEVIGYPKPQVTLEFQRCYNQNNCTNFSPVSKENELEEKKLTNSSHRVTEKMEWLGRAYVPGSYRCVATNEHGTVSSDPLKFLVTESDDVNSKVSLEVMVNGEKKAGKNEVVVLEGDHLTFRCLANKFLISRLLKWKLNDKPLNESRWHSNISENVSEFSYISKFTIENVTMEKNNLELVCMTGDNSTLEAVRSIQINPMEKPKWKNPIGSPLKDVNLKEMGNLTLDCSADGAPAPVVTWYKDGKKLVKTQKHRHISGHKIVFNYLKTTDSGKYKCEVKNRAGTKTAECYVGVTDPDDVIDQNILIIVGVLSFILLVISAVFCRKIYQDRKHTLDLRLKEQKLFNDGDPDRLNPEIGLDQQAELLPYNTKYEVPRDSIIFDKLLGAGAFGRVYRATAINLLPGQARTTVAVKMMKSRTDNAQLKALRSEVKIMIHIGRHVNIVNLLGACSKDLASKGELLLLVEYCKYGNILDYMRRRRKEFVNQINDEDKIDPSISDQRIRQRSGSGSRSRTSRGLKYAHLAFNQDAVHYNNGQISDSNHSGQALWESPGSPPLTPGVNSDSLGPFRLRSTSSSSHHHVTSDMSTLTCESSSGASDGYVSSRAVGPHPASFCTKDLLCWAFQIAKGMEYLAFKKVLHGDLAARNILLAEENIVKISDFGLAKDIYKDENYKKKSSGPVPVKWLALECLRDGVFSTQSDVWSFGVVMWEIFSLGQNPYRMVEFDESFVAKLEKGARLEQPRFSTYELYRIMLDCWNNEPLERPSFSNLEQSLGEILGEAEKQFYLELNQPYQVENTESSFLSLLQSPDYSAKVRDGSPNLDENGYEMPFSPSPCGVVITNEEVHFRPDTHTPRLTPLQMDYLQQEGSVDTEGSASCYLPMSSPSKQSQNVFNFDQETVKSITKRDSEALNENSEETDQVDDDIYLKMDSKSKTNRSVCYNSRENSPLPVKIEDVPRGHLSSNHQGSVSLRHKLVRRASEMEKHDSGLYSPTACMQTNPNYMIMSGFPRTDENNYLTKEDAQEIKTLQADQHHSDQQHYMNFDAVKTTARSLPREYLNEAKSDEEYANLLSPEACRGRTLSESSSGLGSISEGSPPESRIKPDPHKSPVMQSAIMEEPIAA